MPVKLTCAVMSFSARVDQRVRVGKVAAMAHQRAAGALRVVVLGLGKAVVDQERHAGRELRREVRTKASAW